MQILNDLLVSGLAVLQRGAKWWGMQSYGWGYHNQTLGPLTLCYVKLCNGTTKAKQKRSTEVFLKCFFEVFLNPHLNVMIMGERARSSFIDISQQYTSIDPFCLQFNIPRVYYSLIVSWGHTPCTARDFTPGGNPLPAFEPQLIKICRFLIY